MKQPTSEEIEIRRSWCLAPAPGVSGYFPHLPPTPAPNGGDIREEFWTEEHRARVHIERRAEAHRNHWTNR